MYYIGMDTTKIQPITAARATTVRKSYKARPCRPCRPPMYRTDLGEWVPWSYNTQPGRGSLVPRSSNRFSSRSVTGFSRSLATRRKPGRGRSQGGLGADDVDEALGLSFNVPGYTSRFLPEGSSGGFAQNTVAPASGAGSFWSPLDAVMKLWDSRPEAVRKIRVRFNKAKVAQAVSKVISPAQAKVVVDYARKLGLDPSYLSPYGEVPITGDMAQRGFEMSTIDWKEYLPWILGAGAAIVVLPMVLGKRGKR